MVTTMKYSDQFLDEASRFLSIAIGDCGKEEGEVKAFEMMDAFDPELKNELLLHTLMGNVRIRRFTMSITSVELAHNRKIHAIKALRGLSGGSLKTTKEFIDQLFDNGKVLIPLDGNNELITATKDLFTEFAVEMKQCGITVEDRA